MWDDEDWEGEINSLGSYPVSCKFTGNNQDFSLHLISLYALNYRKEGKEGDMVGNVEQPGIYSQDLGLCMEILTQLRQPSEKLQQNQQIND